MRVLDGSGGNGGVWMVWRLGKYRVWASPGETWESGHPPGWVGGLVISEGSFRVWASFGGTEYVSLLRGKLRDLGNPGESLGFLWENGVLGLSTFPTAPGYQEKVGGPQTRGSFPQPGAGVPSVLNSWSPHPG